jgi:hypothetical protein
LQLEGKLMLVGFQVAIITVQLWFSPSDGAVCGCFVICRYLLCGFGSACFLKLLRDSHARGSICLYAAAEESGDGGGEERTVFVLELLQWKRVEGGGALLPRLAALLSSKIDAAEKRGDAPQVSTH